MKIFYFIMLIFFLFVIKNCKHIESTDKKYQEMILQKALEYSDFQKYYYQIDTISNIFVIKSNDIVSLDDEYHITRFDKNIPVYDEGKILGEFKYVYIEITELLYINNSVRLMFDFPYINKYFGFFLKKEKNEWVVTSFHYGEI